MSDPNPDFTSVLTGKTIVLGVSGSIAAYKSADLVSELRRAGSRCLCRDDRVRNAFHLQFDLGDPVPKPRADFDVG